MNISRTSNSVSGAGNWRGVPPGDGKGRLRNDQPWKFNSVITKCLVLLFSAMQIWSSINPRRRYIYLWCRKYKLMFQFEATLEIILVKVNGVENLHLEIDVLSNVKPGRFLTVCHLYAVYALMYITEFVNGDHVASKNYILRFNSDPDEILEPHAFRKYSTCCVLQNFQFSHSFKFLTCQKLLRLLTFLNW